MKSGYLEQLKSDRRWRGCVEMNRNSTRDALILFVGHALSKLLSSLSSGVTGTHDGDMACLGLKCFLPLYRCGGHL